MFLEGAAKAVIGSKSDIGSDSHCAGVTRLELDLLSHLCFSFFYKSHIQPLKICKSKYCLLVVNPLVYKANIFLDCIASVQNE